MSSGEWSGPSATTSLTGEASGRTRTRAFAYTELVSLRLSMDGRSFSRRVTRRYRRACAFVPLYWWWQQPLGAGCSLTACLPQNYPRTFALAFSV